MTPAAQFVCGAWRRDEDPCDAPAGLGTSHPGYGRCQQHYGDTPRHRIRAAELEAIAKAEHVATVLGLPVALDVPEELLGMVRIYTELLGAVRVYTGALAYCELRLGQIFAAGFAMDPAREQAFSDWLGAKYSLTVKWSRCRRKADRAGVGVLAGREITIEALRCHLPQPEKGSP